MASSLIRLSLCLEMLVFAAGAAVASPPVSSDRIAPSVVEDTAAEIFLAYHDPDGDRATACSVSSMTLTVERDCACDAAGRCTVVLRGLPDQYGEASFEYDVTAGGETSQRSAIQLEVIGVEDRPVAITATHPAFAADREAVLELPYRDPDGPAQDCSVGALVHVELTRACACTGGVCTVGVRGLPGYAGTASLQFTVSEGTLVSYPATASLAVGAGVVPVRIPHARDYFGFNVAAHGRRFVVGAPGEATGDAGGASAARVGAAYVYVDPNGDGDWSDRKLEAHLRAGDGKAGDYFGAVVAMTDGVIVVLEDTESWFPPTPNRLHVFEDPDADGHWLLRRVIERPPGARRFGGGVGAGPGFAALAVEGSRIAVGAYQAAAGALDLTGAVYVYEDLARDLDTATVEPTRLVGSDPQHGAGFGVALALEGDVLAVGAPDRDLVRDGVTIADAGAVTVFRHDGERWQEEARLTPAGTSEQSYFGSTIALAGTSLAVSAAGGVEAGSVHLFEYAQGQWRERAGEAIRAQGGSVSDGFGSGGLAFSDGALFVASPFAEGGVGALSVFQDPNGDGDWSDAIEQRVQAAGAPAEQAGDYFGCSFDVSDGTLVVGAYAEDGDGASPPNEALPSSGAVYLFRQTGRSGQSGDGDGNSGWSEHAYGK